MSAARSPSRPTTTARAVESQPQPQPHRLLSVLHRNIRLNQWDSLPHTLAQYADDIDEEVSDDDVSESDSVSSSSSESESDLSSSSSTEMSSSRTFGFANHHQNIITNTTTDIDRGSRKNNYDSFSNSNLSSEFHSSEDYFPRYEEGNEEEEDAEEGNGDDDGEGRLSYHHPPHEIDTSISRRSELRIRYRNNRNRNEISHIPTTETHEPQHSIRDRDKRRPRGRRRSNKNKKVSSSRKKQVPVPAPILKPLPLPEPPTHPSLPLLLQTNAIGWTASHFASLHGAPDLLYWKWILLRVMEEYELHMETIKKRMHMYNKRRRRSLLSMKMKDADLSVRGKEKEQVKAQVSRPRRLCTRNSSSMSNTCPNSSADSDNNINISDYSDSDSDSNSGSDKDDPQEEENNYEFTEGNGYDHGEMVWCDTVNPFFRRTEAGHAATDLFFSKRLHPFPWERVEVKNKAAKLSESIKTILNIVKYNHDNDGTNDDINGDNLNSTIHIEDLRQQQTLLVNELKRRIHSKMEEERIRQRQYGTNSDDILLQLERMRAQEQEEEVHNHQREAMDNNAIVDIDGRHQSRVRGQNRSIRINSGRSRNHLFRNEDVYENEGEGGNDNHRLLRHLGGGRQRQSSSLTEEMDEDGRQEVERDMSLHDHVHETNEIHAVDLAGVWNHGSGDEDEDGGNFSENDDNNDRVTSNHGSFENEHVLSPDGDGDGSNLTTPKFSSSLMENETLDALVDFWHEMELIVMAATQLSLNIDEVDARERGREGGSISNSKISDEAGSTASSPRQWSIVHGLAESGCPEEICQLALALYPNQVRERNHHGDLPLHIAASSHKTSALADGTWQLNEQPYGANASSSPPMLKYMLGVYPEAGMELGAVGRYPINLSISAGKTWIDGVGDIFAACPNAILVGTIDEPTNLPSFLLAAVASNLQMEITAAIPAPSTRSPSNSPNQTVGFQEEMRAKRAASSAIGSMWRFLPAESKARALETAKNDIKMIQITTVFELLRAYPSILVNIGM